MRLAIWIDVYIVIPTGTLNSWGQRAEWRSPEAGGSGDGERPVERHTVSATKTKTSEFRRSPADSKFAEGADEHSHGWGW